MVPMGFRKVRGWGNQEFGYSGHLGIWESRVQGVEDLGGMAADGCDYVE